MKTMTQLQSDKIYSLEELVELVPEIAEFDDFACFPVDEPELKARVVHVNDQIEGAVYYQLTAVNPGDLDESTH